MIDTITLDTPLHEINFDDADSIGEDLIETHLVGDDWSWAWERVIRANGTVRDLRTELYWADIARAAERTEEDQ